MCILSNFCKQGDAASLSAFRTSLLWYHPVMTHFAHCVCEEEERRVRANDREYNEKFQYAVRVNFSPPPPAHLSFNKDVRTLQYSESMCNPNLFALTRVTASWPPSTTSSPFYLSTCLSNSRKLPTHISCFCSSCRWAFLFFSKKKKKILVALSEVEYTRAWPGWAPGRHSQSYNLL